MGYFKNLDIERQEQLLADTYYGADEPEMSPEELMLPDEDEIEAMPQPEQDIEPDFCWEAEEPEPEDIDESGYDSEYAPEMEHEKLMNVMSEYNKFKHKDSEIYDASDYFDSKYSDNILYVISAEYDTDIKDEVHPIHYYYNYFGDF